MNDEVIAALKLHPEVVIIAQSNHPNRLGEYRAMTHELMNEGLENPVVFFQYYQETKAEDLQIKAAADMGALIFDGLCDGIFLYNQGPLSHIVVDTTAFWYPASRQNPNQQNGIHFMSGMWSYLI